MIIAPFYINFLRTYYMSCYEFLFLLFLYFHLKNVFLIASNENITCTKKISQGDVRYEIK